MNYKNYIAEVQDFPIEGISFKDITPILQNGKVFQEVTNELAEFVKSIGANVVVGPESRGFIFGCPVATKLGLSFVPIRKPGKLPRKTVSKDYSLEYGVNTLCMHADGVKKGDKVVIIDDLLATGGTVKAARELIEECGGEVVGAAFVVELINLKGRRLFSDITVKSLVTYEDVE